MVISTAILLAWLSPAWSRTIIGTQFSCGTWVQERSLAQHPKRAQAEAWIVGYLSGVNNSGTGSDMLLGLDEAIYSWMDNYCRSHPLGRVETGFATAT